jgi:hypothetical protein
VHRLPDYVRKGHVSHAKVSPAWLFCDEQPCISLLFDAACGADALLGCDTYHRLFVPTYPAMVPHRKNHSVCSDWCTQLNKDDGVPPGCARLVLDFGDTIGLTNPNPRVASKFSRNGAVLCQCAGTNPRLTDVPYRSQVSRSCIQRVDDILSAAEKTHHGSTLHVV